MTVAVPVGNRLRSLRKERGIEASPELVKEIFSKAKSAETILAESEILEICGAHGVSAS